MELALRPGLRHPDPSYVWRPDRLLRRAATAIKGEERPLVELPWGASLEVDASDLLGAGIARLGTYELTVSETMWRLAAADDLALDVGANVGYYACLLAHRAGRVLAFEPHPALAAHLRANVARWRAAEVEVLELAASDTTGTASLSVPAQFSGNTGVASLGGGAGGEDDGAGGESVEVRIARLDEIVGEAAVGILKVDVEGHELEVLSGLGAALAAGRVRDVFFEEYEPLPTAVSSRLEANGFRVFSLQQRLRGVDLGAVAGPRPRWYAPTYLATTDPDRARRLLAGRGWNCLRPRRRRGR